MSILLGAWQFSDKLEAVLSLSKMSDAVINLPSDTYKFTGRQQVRFGALIRCNTPEATYEPGPLYLEKEEILYSSQGRIDNREKLSELLNIRNGTDKPDSYFMLQAYLKWGKESVHYLRGDWSFAVFDYRTQELFIARDALGYTSLFFYMDETGFYFSSSIKSLLALPSYRKQLNELHFVRHLTLWDHTKVANETYFKNIFVLPISHTLNVKNKMISVRKHWDPSSCSLRNYKSNQQYADELSELFTNAVKARLRSNQPVASMLSGGLDSSAVSYTAADILKGTASLTTFSHVPLFTEQLKNDKERLHKNLDETSYIKKVAEASGNIHPRFLNSENQSLLGGIREFLDIYSAPVHAAANVYWLIDLYRTAVNLGYGSLLTGEGGNGSISFAGVDRLLPLQWANLFSSPYYFVRRQIAGPFKRWMTGRLLGKPSTGNDMEQYVKQIYVNPDIIKKYQIIEDIRSHDKRFRPVVSDVTSIKELFVDLYRTRSLAGAVFGQYFGFELRDPCTDQDLMEYFFSIPNEAFFDEHYNNRMLVKRMMRNKIPDEVLFAKKGGLQSADIVYRVQTQAMEIAEAIGAVRESPAVNHYIDTKRLAESFQAYLMQPYVEPYQVQRTLKTLQFALFLQEHFD